MATWLWGISLIKQKLCRIMQENKQTKTQNQALPVVCSLSSQCLYVQKCTITDIQYHLTLWSTFNGALKHLSPPHSHFETYLLSPSEAMFDVCYLELPYSVVGVSSRRGTWYQILWASFIPPLRVCTTSILFLILAHLLAHKAPLNSQTTLIRLPT